MHFVFTLLKALCTGDFPFFGWLYFLSGELCLICWGGKITDLARINGNTSVRVKDIYFFILKTKYCETETKAAKSKQVVFSWTKAAGAKRGRTRKLIKLSLAANSELIEQQIFIYELLLTSEKVKLWQQNPWLYESQPECVLLLTVVSFSFDFLRKHFHLKGTLCKWKKNSSSVVVFGTFPGVSLWAAVCCSQPITVRTL